MIEGERPRITGNDLRAQILLLEPDAADGTNAMVFAFATMLNAVTLAEQSGLISSGEEVSSAPPPASKPLRSVVPEQTMTDQAVLSIVGDVRAGELRHG